MRMAVHVHPAATALLFPFLFQQKQYQLHQGRKEPQSILSIYLFGRPGQLAKLLPLAHLVQGHPNHQEYSQHLPALPLLLK